jgi:hypothetical protein
LTGSIFTKDACDHLASAGWRFATVPAGLTLAGLRAAGAPFKGAKYFDQQANETHELSVEPAVIAYAPGLPAETLNQSFDRCLELFLAPPSELPPHVRPTIQPAALYAWLLWEHARHHGEWLLQGRYTWCADRSGTTHLALGVFGRERPLLVTPIPEGHGRGLGAWPILVPAGR